MTFKQYVDNGIRFHNYKLVLLDLRSSVSDWDVSIIEVHAPDIRTAIFQGHVQWLSKFRTDADVVGSNVHGYARMQSTRAQVTGANDFGFIESNRTGEIVFILRDDNKHYDNLEQNMYHSHIKEYLREVESAEHILKEFDVIHEMNKLSTSDDAIFNNDFLGEML